MKKTFFNLNTIFFIGLFLFINNFTSVKAVKSIDEEIGQMIIVGFQGKTHADPEVQIISKYIQEGKIGGVILFGYNIENPDQLKKLVSHLRNIPSSLPLIVWVDQEGGKVARLNAKNGFKSSLSHQEIAKLNDKNKAKEAIQEIALMLKDAGINGNLAPDVDVDFTPPSPVIGGFGRSFSADPNMVVDYGRLYLQTMKEHNIFACIKHYPGHGSAQGDTHEDIIDITKTWDEKRDLLPFKALANETPAIMSAHLYHQDLGKDAISMTFSKKFIKEKLINEIKFPGVMVSDDMHMGAILKHVSFEDSIKKGTNAGLHMFIFSNNPNAAKKVEWFKPDIEIPEKFISCVKKSIEINEIKIEDIHDAYNRILKLKKDIKG